MTRHGVSARRIERLLGQFAQYELDGILLSHPANITYLCSYPSRDSFLLVGKAEAVYFTDSRYTDEARAALPSSFIVERIDAANPFIAVLKRSCISRGIKRLGFEERFVSVLEHRKLHEQCAGTVDLVPVVNLVEHLRQIKDADEIAAIRAAVGVTARVYAAARRILKPGITELEAVGELERCIRRNGADGPSFEIIVASGPHGAYPHHISGRRKLRSGDAVVLDMGVVYRGYRSDLTRVFFLGKISALVRRVYEIVREAQEKAIALVRPGLLIADADAAARSFITERGYADAFGHNLGHGVGLETHELPYLSGKSGARFEPGMVVTVEPGIYLPNRFGIRIEDMVLVTGKKGEVLSGAIDK
jgi:Xaa-Pro aminopeptidase